MHSNIEISIAQAALGGTILVQGVHEESMITVSHLQQPKNELNCYTAG